MNICVCGVPVLCFLFRDHTFSDMSFKKAFKVQEIFSLFYGEKENNDDCIPYSVLLCNLEPGHGKGFPGSSSPGDLGSLRRDHFGEWSYFAVCGSPV